MTTRRYLLHVWLVAFFLLVAARVEAQGMVHVSGTVTGPAGQPLSGIPIHLSWTGGWRDLVTDGAGRYAAQVNRGADLTIDIDPPPETRLVRWLHWQIVSANLVKDVHLQRGNLLSGRAILADGQPVGQPRWLSALPFVAVLPEGEWLGSDVAPDGRFAIVLPPDVYRLELNGLAPGTYNALARVDLRGGDVPDYIYRLTTQRPPAVPATPPVAARIHVDAPDVNGMAIVHGDVGACEPLAPLVLATLDIDSPTVTVSNADGSFRTALFAPRGCSVLVKQGYDPRRAQWAAGVSNTAGDESDITPWPSTMVSSPLSDTDPADGQDFQTCGVVPTAGAGPWTAWGTSGPLRSGSLPIRGTLRIFAPGVNAGTNLRTIRVQGWASMRPVFRADGGPVSVDQSFMSDLLTPSGLPIERHLRLDGYQNTGFALGPWQRVPGNVHALDAAFSFNLAVGSLGAGLYQPVLHFEFPDGLPPAESLHTTRSSYFLKWWNDAWLPVVKLGNPAAPRLEWCLLMDEFSSGSRGVVAREDIGHFNLAHHIITQAERFIVERTDAQTGQPRVYRLEPYLPMLSFSDRGLPNAPAIAFRFPSGQLTVRVQRPSGAVDTLGPTPFVQTTSRTPCDLDGNIYEVGTGHLDDVLQLTTLNDAFGYAFREYGHHVITVNGSIQDIYGNTYSGGGTYDVYVARTLIFDAGSVPASPYIVGDVFNPKVQTHPAVAADITLRLRQYPNSDAARVTTQTASGRASRYGFFDARAVSSPLRFTSQGEYRIDLTGVYTDTDGTLWMGHVTWGNVIEPTTPQIIAHGRRGLDTLQDINQSLPWFFHRTQPVVGTTHSPYPYFSGDILWGQDKEAFWGGDAIKPMATFQDLDGRATQLLRSRLGTTQTGPEGPGNFEQRAAVGEVPLLCSTSTGIDPALAPEQVDQWGYAYRSSERPSVHVHDDVSEDMMSTGYWRFNDNYGHRVGVGVLGDLANDIKWQYVGVVFRNPRQNVYRYGAYASLWVLAPDSDPLGARTMPPFQGAAGGPSGGPIMTLKGKPIDLFFLPMGVQPGSVLEVGQSCSFSGQVGPPLNARLAVTITSPGGVAHVIQARADKVGYLYDPAGDFVVTEPGRWTVDVNMVFDGQTPTGPVLPPYPDGDVLGSANGRYEFYVVPARETPLAILAPRSGFLSFNSSPLPPVSISGAIPAGWRDVRVYYTIAMPGSILKQGQCTPSASTFRFNYDPETLAHDFPNLDLVARDEQRPGLADLVTISILANGRNSQGAPANRACVTTLLAQEVQNTRFEQPFKLYLPVVVRP